MTPDSPPLAVMCTRLASHTFLSGHPCADMRSPRWICDHMTEGGHGETKVPARKVLLLKVFKRRRVCFHPTPPPLPPGPLRGAPGSLEGRSSMKAGSDLL